MKAFISSFISPLIGATLLALFLFAITSNLAIAEENTDFSDLAIFSISFEIEGMRPDNLPPGTGDRALTFALKFPADNAEVANELFYSHIGILFGEDEQSELHDFARSFSRK